MNKIKRIGIILISALLSGILVLGASIAVAEQPQSPSEESICNPIGLQLNLDIHGNYPSALSNEKVLPDGNYIFKNEYYESTMQYIANKKLTITDPTIFEPYIGSFNDASHDASLKPILPSVEEEFYIVGKVQAESNRDQNSGHNCSSLLCPNLVIEAYTDAHPDDPLPVLGLSSIRNPYNVSPEEFVRLERTTSQEEQPPGITSLFKWLGWLCRTIFIDTNEDGDIHAYGFAVVATD